ncbi:MAG: hypothetical protein HGA45_37525, partial [Chloroflexales bacterium]|nr:hypothetical protein [Chloroflexales bacterium]
FSQSNVEALMVTGSKPRFEIKLDGEVKQTFPATRAWRAEKLAAVAAAQSLLITLPGRALAEALASLPLTSAGVKPSRKVVAFDVATNGDGSHSLTACGGKNAAERAQDLANVGAFLESRGLVVTLGAGKLLISEPAAQAA